MGHVENCKTRYGIVTRSCITATLATCGELPSRSCTLLPTTLILPAPLSSVECPLISSRDPATNGSPAQV